jgi:hypothetical protein
VGDAWFVSATPSQGTCNVTYLFLELDIHCALGSLASGNSATVAVVVTPNAEGLLTSTASVASNVSDPDGADNGAVETTTVVDVIFADGFDAGGNLR